MLTPLLTAALAFLQAGPQPQMVVRTPPKPKPLAAIPASGWSWRELSR